MISFNADIYSRVFRRACSGEGKGMIRSFHVHGWVRFTRIAHFLGAVQSFFALDNGWGDTNRRAMLGALYRCVSERVYMHTACYFVNASLSFEHAECILAFMHIYS